MRIIIHFLFFKSFSFNFLLSLRLSCNLTFVTLIATSLSDPFHAQTSSVNYILWPYSPFLFASTFSTISAVSHSLNLPTIFFTEFGFFIFLHINSHCQPIATASNPFFLFLICYALPPIPVRNHKLLFLKKLVI